MAGEPDIYGCYKGQAFVIEMKRKGGKPTPIQEYRLNEWKESGALAIVATSTEEAMAVIALIGEASVQATKVPSVRETGRTTI